MIAIAGDEGELLTPMLMSGKQPLALYIHIPFCSKKCHYCSFYTIPYREGLIELYCDQVLQEGLHKFASLKELYFIDTVFFESAKRLLATLENIKLTRGADCKIAIGRELTKIFEEIKTGTPDEIISYYNDNPLKGEIIGLIYADEKSGDDDGVDDKIKSLQALNYSAKDISQILNALYGVNKNKIYKSAIKKD